jgi:hypothetical protein|tara:strand:- start:155 stop:373 length:219 start_codon:yes stop_codon:yes gene_type:complete
MLDSALDDRVSSRFLFQVNARWFDMGVRLLLFCSTEHGMHARPRREAVNANEYEERRGAKSQGFEAEPTTAQ